MDFRYCLNTSTIKGQGLNLQDEIEITAKAGYDAIEPWISELDDYIKDGGSYDDLKRQFSDAGLTVENLIGFFTWAVDDPADRQAGFDEAKRNLEQAAAIGCKKLAAAPMGLVDVESIDYIKVAERYHEMLELGKQYDVIPVLEFWGVSKSLGRMGEALYIAAESGHPDACILADVYHIYKKGTPHKSIRMLSGDKLGLVHINDYPADPPIETITDADRIYPGDGIAPMTEFLRDLDAIGYDGALSLELFNESYWAQDALAVATTGLEKIKECVNKAFA
ncbi:MAG: sugar phosphate isomerase/epimerase [Lentisphaeria bacterium]|nr:sugar phosphate isomerase/epimerase [Lentisphaeria bacterium]NQZ71358.1 sugar phosphate isomerase/epimerase [Lentisphaeria bacterium]